MIVQQPLPLRSARVVAMALVPAAKASNSNTPIGPFQITVLQSARASWNTFTESGPMSRPIQPSGMASTLAIWLLASGAKLSASTTSVGSRNCTPLAAALASSSLASSSLSSSTRLLPTARPRAL